MGVRLDLGCFVHCFWKDTLKSKDRLVCERKMDEVVNKKERLKKSES